MSASEFSEQKSCCCVYLSVVQSGQTPLHKAAIAGHVWIVERLLIYDITCVDQQDKVGEREGGGGGGGEREGGRGGERGGGGGGKREGGGNFNEGLMVIGLLDQWSYHDISLSPSLSLPGSQHSSPLCQCPQLARGSAISPRERSQ